MDNTIILRCSRCKVEKPESDFNRHKGRRTGRHHYCKICVRRHPNTRKPVYDRPISRTPPLDSITPGHLWCTGCNSEKLPELFSLNKWQRQGRANWCKACTKALWQRPEYLTRRLERRYKNLSHSLAIECRARARKRGIPSDITGEDLPIPDLCPVLGIPLHRKSGKRLDNSPSVDRLNPAKGYVKGNVAIVSWMANRLKSDCGDPAVFDAIAAYIRRGLSADQSDRLGIPSASAV